MFRWTPEATQEQKQRVAAELSRLPALLPVLRAYRVGRGPGHGRGQLRIRRGGRLRRPARGYLTYRDNPEHRAIIAEFIQPIIAERAAVQYEF